MKMLRTLALTYVSIALLAACGQQREQASNTIRARGINPQSNQPGIGGVSGSTQYQVPAGKTLGSITGFNPAAARQLVSPSVPIGNVQTVSFWGSVPFSAGSINPQAAYKVVINLNDDQMSKYGNTPVFLDFESGLDSSSLVYGQSYVDGNGQAVIQIVVADSYGSIIFDGSYNSGTNMYSGTVGYTNGPMSSNNPASQNWIQFGQFSIPACSFFAC